MLISVVECRPILREKSQDLHKDKNETKNAWEEICTELKY